MSNFGNLELMQSIQPVHCLNILRGDKTIELRKTIPTQFCRYENFEIVDFKPFKTNIYCTKPKSKFDKGLCLNEGKVDWYHAINRDACKQFNMPTLDGKIVGEYICDKIFVFSPFNRNDIATPFDITEEELAQMCLTYDDVMKYGNNSDVLFGYHISDLVVYDMPKELSEYLKPCPDKYEYCNSCKYAHISYPDWVETYEDTFDCSYNVTCLNRITKAPQSWGYCRRTV